MREKGHPVITLGFGEPDFDTPVNIREAAKKAMDGGQTRYPATAGTLDLKKAIQQKFLHENDLSFELDEIIVCTGGKHVLFNGFMASINPGDEVIIPAPYWTTYPDMIAACEGKTIAVPCSINDGYKITPQALEAAITPKTKWLLINSPCNPTGAVYSADELIALAEVLRAHPHVWVMTDDIYEHICFTGEPYATMAVVAPDLGDRTLTINGVSKAYSMTGWRIGYGAGPKELIKAMTALQGQSTSGANSIAQAAAVEALSGPQDFVQSSLETFKTRRDRVVEWINECPGLVCPMPQGAFYVYPDCRALLGKRTPQGQEIKTPDDLTIYLLEHHDVAVISSLAFGTEGGFRLSYATSIDVLEEACKRIRQGCKALI